MGRKRDRDRGKHQCVAASCASPTGDLAHNPSMCPNWESNWWPHGLQASAQSTEPLQPGQYIIIFKCSLWKIIRELSSFEDSVTAYSKRLIQSLKRGKRRAKSRFFPFASFPTTWRKRETRGKKDLKRATIVHGAGSGEYEMMKHPKIIT